VRELYAIFELEPRAELSTRPDNKVGDDALWDHAEGILERVLQTHEMEYVIGEGEGVFYGPKIDLHVTDSLGRSWQMATIQLDYHQPKQFGNTFMGEDNREHTPAVIHRAVYGSFERFIGILTEHYAGAFPFWLAPVQVRIIPVGESHRPDANEVARQLRDAGFRVEVDERDETVGKRIRDAELEKIPKTIVYGDKESHESLAIRDRGGEQSRKSLVDFAAELATLRP
jgi:threonyl-tRNA synthetase